jgi:hypothetical protein
MSEPKVEWNPTGDVWMAADVMETRDGGQVVIRLRENGQQMVVEPCHLRDMPTVSEFEGGEDRG